MIICQIISMTRPQVEFKDAVVGHIGEIGRKELEKFLHGKCTAGDFLPERFSYNNTAVAERRPRNPCCGGGSDWRNCGARMHATSTRNGRRHCGSRLLGKGSYLPFVHGGGVDAGSGILRPTVRRRRRVDLPAYPNSGRCCTGFLVGSRPAITKPKP